MTASTQAYEFKAEIQQLLNILVHSLYTDREIFLRELVSNASDAIHRVQFEMLTNKDVLDAEVEPSIKISVDETAKTITIVDTGIGMNRDEMVENLGTIAHSGASSFLQALKDRGTGSTDIIGQFGVGFYSVFMIADKVEVTSRSFRTDDQANTWICDGGSQYSIEPATKTTRGTEIVVHVKEDAAEYLNAYTLERIIKKHSNYVPFPVSVGDKVANEQQALWRRTPREVTEAEYEAFYKQISFDYEAPLLTVHQASDAPVQFYSLLFVPAQFDRGIFSPDFKGGPRLYARKVLIQEHSRDLLPEWMRFVVGVVDSEDLPLNISRETVQSNKLMQKLKTTITNKLINEVAALAEKEPERFNKVWEQFGRMMKEGVATDPASKDKLASVLRFHSSQREGWISLKDYIEKMAEGQGEIYYLFGDDLKTLNRSPHLDAFKKRGIEVLLLDETIDGFVVNALAEFEGKKLHNGADAELELPDTKGDDQPEADKPEPLPAGELSSLIERFTTVLGEKISGVRESKVLTDSPVRLVAADKGLGADMERLYRAIGQEFAPTKRVLEINPNHPLIRNLAAMGDVPLANEVMEQLLDTALLIEGIHPNPAEMVPRLQALMQAATRQS